MPIDLEILAYEETPLGILCLRRRKTLREPRRWITEITLNHEFLMSSLHTDSEEALATLPLGMLSGHNLQVLVGGLGLGYTALAALRSPHVQSVDVIEYLPQVIVWTQKGLTPVAAELNADPRLGIEHNDIFQILSRDAAAKQYDAILIDIDHSPDDQLVETQRDLYNVSGLSRAAGHLRPGGVFALWSYAEASPLLEVMPIIFPRVTAHPITCINQLLDESFTDWLYVGQLD
jgi:spermidine synthase